MQAAATESPDMPCGRRPPAAAADEASTMTAERTAEGAHPVNTAYAQQTAASRGYAERATHMQCGEHAPEELGEEDQVPAGHRDKMTQPARGKRIGGLASAQVRRVPAHDPGAKGPGVIALRTDSAEHRFPKRFERARQRPRDLSSLRRDGSDLAAREPRTTPRAVGKLARRTVKDRNGSARQLLSGRYAQPHGAIRGR